ncbi:heavy metal-binding protein HIP-like [Saccostrea echinata]|uniref:heavy metal-binding protein HIP-like n=1 Tax=Saccostrea echinata TaxID=191078 RepID=UPI002A83C8E3|nr:heavy metal-binding protein HIP-like [Saccostrea echinata]
MYIFQFLKLILASFLLSGANAEAGTKDFLKKFIKYNDVCRGMGFKGDNCKGHERAIISFHAEIANSLQNLGNNAVVVFGKVTENSGSAYNGKTGKFTAPKDGIYLFTWTILTTLGKKFVTNIVLNDMNNALAQRWHRQHITSNIMGYNHVDGKRGSQNFSTGSATTIIKMKKNDKVWIRTRGKEGEYAYGNWSSFSGFKLS